MKKLKLTTRIFIGLILGGIVGFLLQGSPEIAESFIKPIGTIFIHLIKMIIVPLVFSTLIVGAASIGDIRSLGRIGGKTILYYLLTTGFAVAIGIILAKVLNVGAGLSIPIDATEIVAKEAPSLTDTLINIIPKNPLKGIVEGAILQVIAFALFLGVSSAVIPDEKAKPFISFFESLSEIMYKLTAFIMELAPFGVFGLIAPVFAKYGVDVIKPLAMVILAVYIGCLLHAILVYSTAAKVIANISPIAFFKGIMPASVMAFSTSSSSGTLPVTIQCVKENLGVSEKISSFVLPLGATINMDGTALYQGVCALFIAQVYGVELTMVQMGTIIVTATLGSIGSAGVPGAGFIMLTLVLQSVGLPLEGLVLIAGVDRLLDMARTSVNVTGDASAAVIVAATEGELNLPEIAKARRKV